MAKYTVTLSVEEEKALLAELVSISDWLTHAIHNKARKCIDRVVGEVSEYQPSKLTKAHKLQIIRDADIKTAKQKEEELSNKEEVTA